MIELAARFPEAHALPQRALNQAARELLLAQSSDWAFLMQQKTAQYYAAQRTIVPELFGSDERIVARASALFGGATHLTMIAGPALGGVLVAFFGAPAVLLVDAATYVVAFALVLGLVRGGAPVVHDDATRGVLAGVRFLVRDPLFGTMTLTIILLDAAGNALFASLPALAFFRFHRDPHVAGWLFAAFGVGALAGSIVAMKALERVRPLRLAAVSILLAVLPLWLLVATLPAYGVGAALLACGVFVPLVNAPIMGLLSTRPPQALRAKVMTAVMTASALGGPAGRIVVGPLFEGWGIAQTYAVIAAALSVGAAAYAAVALAEQKRDPVPALDLTAV